MEYTAIIISNSSFYYFLQNYDTYILAIRRIQSDEENLKKIRADNLSEQ